jgi:hypothetical protein
LINEKKPILAEFQSNNLDIQKDLLARDVVVNHAASDFPGPVPGSLSFRKALPANNFS